ncbi:MAG TPA: tetratricopeptide repeat protein, partial [Azospirillaceae bacterium]|nr:tetratricopeptide repeat protein [Azospirillaceae bacterium]
TSVDFNKYLSNWSVGFTLEAYYNLGLALERQGLNQEAEATYQRVLARNPDLATATHNLGTLSLNRGDLARGWEGHEKRFQARAVTPWRRPPMPRWNGEPLAGRRLLVWREQGVGDEILFSSCYRQLADLDGEVIVECEARLASLLARAFPSLRFRAESCTRDGDETLADLGADLHCPAGSLPRLLRRRLADFPSDTSWLKPLPTLAARWRTRVSALGRGLKIGICWRSQLRDKERDASYTALMDWAPLLRQPGVLAVNLQYDDCAAEIDNAEQRLGVTVRRWADLDMKDDFESTAALISNLDLVVTVATSVGELSAALGVPTWRIGRANDWSALGTACRPWYSAMRLWSSHPGENLPSVLARSAMALRLLAPPPQTPPERAINTAAAAPLPTEPLLRKAVAAQQAGKTDLAATLYRRLLAIDPTQADGLHLMGLLRYQTGSRDGGEPHVRRALRIDPEFAFAANNLGLVRQARGDGGGAGRAFAHALKLRPDFAEAITHLGVLRQHLKDYDQAARLHRRAIRLKPLSAAFRNNLGTALERAGRFDAAAAAYRSAAALDPCGLADMLNNLGMAARQNGALQTAKAWMARALRIDPRHGLAAWNLGLLQLADGDLTGGWAGYERRFAAATLQPPRAIRLPVWRGEALRGERLLVWGEQGVGDEILFASCLADLAGLDGQVVLECDHRLVSLFARAFPWAEVRASEGEPGGPERRVPSDCDYQLPIGSLPALTRRQLADFPQAKPAYLSPRDDLVAVWRKRLNDLPNGIRVGVAWTSQVVDAYRAAAYMKLADWLPMLRVPGVVGVNLQYGDTRDELRRLREESGATLESWPDLDLKDDFESVAALMSQLDLVVCPASSVGELSAALGVPTWRVCGKDWTHFGADVRPWFPTMRAMRPPTGDALATAPRMAANLLRRLRQ